MSFGLELLVGQNWKVEDVDLGLWELGLEILIFLGGHFIT